VLLLLLLTARMRLQQPLKQQQQMTAVPSLRQQRQITAVLSLKQQRQMTLLQRTPQAAAAAGSQCS
jgi:hypothetical protein